MGTNLAGLKHMLIIFIVSLQTVYIQYLTTLGNILFEVALSIK